MAHTWQMRVCFQDTDAEGIVYHANYLKYAERARTDWITALGLSNRGIMAGGHAIVLRHLEMDFFEPARLDDVLTINVLVDEIKNASMQVRQEVSCGNHRVAEVRLQLAFVNTTSLRPTRLDSAMKDLFINYMQHQGEN